MSVRFVTGAPGTGKTELCLREITARLRQPEALYYLVPEQFSLHSEKRLTQLSSAYTQVQAISFNRLAYQLFAKLGGPPGKVVDETGRRMLLRKILFECADELACYGRSADKQGFIDGLARTLTELNHYGVIPGELQACLPDSPKMRDLALIFEKYRETVEGRYLLTDETLTLLCKRLGPEGGETGGSDPRPLAGSIFWVDGFSGFTPQERGVLGHIMQMAAQVTFTLTLRENDPFFQTTGETLRVLTELAQSLKVPVEAPVRLTTDHRHENQPELCRFTEYFPATGTPVPAWREPPRVVESVLASDRHAEVYEAARYIRQWVNEEKYRFRDIAVLCGDRGAYEKLLRNAFARLDIPLFVDSRQDILSHPLTELIRAAVDVALRNWPYESVFRFLKTRLTPLTQDETDLLENYVLAHGVKAYYWRYPFEDETAEAARLKTLDALAPFTEKLRASKKETVRAYSTRVFDMLYALRVPETLTALYDERMSAGDPETARLHRQIWPKICEVFDKLVEILGDETVTLKVFAKILDAGLMQADLGLIPPAVDQVFLGDIGRSRFPDIKALIVLGANEGRLPPPSASEGLFTDDERNRLRRGGLELAPEASRRAHDDGLSLYHALCQPREKLVFLRAATEPRSRALKRVSALFPALSERNAGPLTEYPPVAPQNAPPIVLSKQTANRLYGHTVITAASRMEGFAECPFAYYVTHNLKARERKIYEVRSADLGVVFHDVLALFSKELTEAGIPWGTLRRDEIAQRVDACVEAAVPEEQHVLRGTARNRHVMRRVKHICTASVWALSEHIRRGSFKPVGFELDFKPDTPVTTLEVRLNDERRLILTGRIDRVDILNTDDGSCYVKIIDYKSGKRRFDLSEVLMGTQLQLMLYLSALLKNGGALFGGDNIAVEAKPGGVFYFHIDDPVLETDDLLADEQREEKLLRCFKMSGLVLAEPEAVAGLDESLRDKGGESLIVPVRVNSNGAFGKASSVLDKEGFEQLGRAVNEKIKEIGLKMTEGVIKPDPFQNKKRSACDYCRYGALCGAGVN